MSEHNHTPGPWRVGDAGTAVFGPPNGNPSPQTIAAKVYRREDVKLIAAAPDLLAALELAEATIIRVSERHGPAVVASVQGTLGVIRATIAAATGEKVPT